MIEQPPDTISTKTLCALMGVPIFKADVLESMSKISPVMRSAHGVYWAASDLAPVLRGLARHLVTLAHDLGPPVNTPTDDQP
jgi:hypothetical protein